ncbi:MAG: preprotein translocase subunit SecG [Candidatus Wildermuthbacteria bacterium]|nr:preprotein translocase subunit SecG [Candidatus Wildermuthbacteria bacterium]
MIIAILLQQRGTALGLGMGGDSGFYATRRGIQEKLFWATIVLLILFAGLSIASLRF